MMEIKGGNGAFPASGSGYSAEPEPEEVSAVPVSIPNAEPYFQFVHAAYSPPCLCHGREPDQSYIRFNFDLCRALDMTSMSVVLGKMVAADWLDKQEAEVLHLQASALLASMRSANGRAYASAMSTGTAKTPKAVEGQRPASAAPKADAQKASQ